MMLGPYDFSDTETLCRDLVVRLHASGNQILAKLITTWLLKKYCLYIGCMWKLSFLGG